MQATTQRFSASVARMGAAVEKAGVTAQREGAAIKTARGAAGHASETTTTLQAKLKELLRVSPPDLLPLVRETAAKVDELAGENAALRGDLDEVEAAQTELEDELAEARNAKALADGANAAALKAQAEYVAAADKLAKEATLRSAGEAAANNKVRALQSQNLLRKLAEAAAAVALLGISFLWITGRIARSGAQIASHIPTL